MSYKLSDLREKSEEALHELAVESGVKVLKSDSKEELVQKLLVSSYSILRIPSYRPTSQRGYVLGRFLSPDGEPHQDGTDLESVVEGLVEKFSVERDKAEATVRLYKRDLVRYYGYDVVSDEDGVIVFSDRRKKVKK